MEVWWIVICTIWNENLRWCFLLWYIIQMYTFINVAVGVWTICYVVYGYLWWKFQIDYVVWIWIYFLWSDLTERFKLDRDTYMIVYSTINIYHIHNCWTALHILPDPVLYFRLHIIKLIWGVLQHLFFSLAVLHWYMLFCI